MAWQYPAKYDLSAANQTRKIGIMPTRVSLMLAIIDTFELLFAGFRPPEFIK
jgi:hypothetical protein